MVNEFKFGQKVYASNGRYLIYGQIMEIKPLRSCKIDDCNKFEFFPYYHKGEYGSDEWFAWKNIFLDLEGAYKNMLLLMNKEYNAYTAWLKEYHEKGLQSLEEFKRSLTPANAT